MFARLADKVDKEYAGQQIDWSVSALAQEEAEMGREWNLENEALLAQSGQPSA
ncbi:hypothetical protein KTT_57440 [Tengunoibacter tsumagoiensis]|uniref:Uncharacterized protein n=1 Tax=Tengunoibacter tsumagoiensis TaxID=2014871 RepID=A0A402AAA5_9CHLR|nr:hypothetical protein KTT_57440 [Tengunoibacter tsumagoiensis]